MSDIEIPKTPEIITSVDQAFIEDRPLSPSSMKQFAKSPQHYIAYLNKKFVQTADMKLGSLIDLMILEPEKVKSTYEVYVKASGTGSQAVNKNVLEQISKAKKIAITKEDLEIAEKCKQAIMDTDETRILIEGKTLVQKTLRWRDKANNLPLIGKVDFEAKAWDTDFAVDLKSSISADPDDFIRQAVNLRYHLQTGAYLDGYKKTQFRFPTFAFLVVEKKEPFGVSIVICDSHYVEKAMAEWYGILKAFRYCLHHDHFDKGYEFRKFGTADYFSMSIPKYYKPAYPEGFDLDDDIE